MPGRLLAALLLAPSAAAAADGAAPYPQRPVRIVVPFPPGGSTDMIARAIGQRLAPRWGQAVVVDNRPGGATMIGAEIVARSAPDGHTLLVGTINHVVNPYLYRKMSYDPVKDLAPVTQMTSTPILLTTHPNSAATSVRDMIAHARARPGSLTIGTAGNGSTGHLATELMSAMAGIAFTHVPYKGSNPALTEVIGGQLGYAFVEISTSMPLVGAGRLKAVAVSSAARARILPDVPTVAESGLPGYSLTAWSSILARGGTPAGLVSRLHSDIAAALKGGELEERLNALGSDVVAGTPAQFARFLEAERDKIARISKTAKLGIE